MPTRMDPWRRRKAEQRWLKRRRARTRQRRRRFVVAAAQWLAIAAGALALLLGTDTGRWVLFMLWSAGGQ